MTGIGSVYITYETNYQMLQTILSGGLRARTATVWT